MEWLLDRSPVLLAFFATIYTWGLTALGSSMVFFFKTINKKTLNIMLGFAAGVMIAASFWSLLKPAIEISESQGNIGWLTAAIGFLSGGVFLYILDRILPHLHMHLTIDKAEGITTSWNRSILLVLAITLHHIPEGLAVGVAFGMLANNPDMGALTAAVALTIGIGLQNFPEGAAVSIPLRNEGFTRSRAFKYGQLSGMVEPIFGVIGALLVTMINPLMPYALSFAAGAMIFVVAEELIPESQTGNETDLSTLGLMFGFVVMMALELGF